MEPAPLTGPQPANPLLAPATPRTLLLLLQRRRRRLGLRLRLWSARTPRPALGASTLPQRC
jgi:hypothetical protein